MPEAEMGKAVQVLDLLLEYFGDRGEHWTRDCYNDGGDRRCLVGRPPRSAAGLFVARVGAGIPAFEIYSTMTCPYIHGWGAQM